jgi:hypothetical protein
MLNRMFVFVLMLLLFACNNNVERDTEYHFYHWRTNSDIGEKSKEALSLTNKVYLRLFDINFKKGKAVPLGVVKSIDSLIQDHEIIPCIFITNRVFQNKINLEELASKVESLIREISSHHQIENINQVQLDCDWSTSTREEYFQFIELMKNHFEISVTLRLHQIKYAQKTGVPPVESASLMVYNMGELEDELNNSILDISILKSYVNSETTYPMPINVSFPLYSQTVIHGNSGKVKLISKSFKNNEKILEKLDLVQSNLYRLNSDTLLNGFFLRENQLIEFEIIEEKELKEAISIIKASSLNINDYLFYHLDETTLENINFKSILESL